MSENTEPVEGNNRENDPNDGPKPQSEPQPPTPAPQRVPAAETEPSPRVEVVEKSESRPDANSGEGQSEPPAQAEKTGEEVQQNRQQFRGERRNPNQRRPNNNPRRNQPQRDNRPKPQQQTEEIAEPAEKPEQQQIQSSPRAERNDRPINQRQERNPRAERIERVDRKDRDDRKDHDERNPRVDKSQKPHQPQRSSSNEKISIVIPLFNEEQSLRPLYSEIRKVFENARRPYEIVFVDDGSSDKSLMRIKEIARMDNRVKYLSFQKNYGKSAALQMGFKMATGNIIITMDADLQDDPKEIPNLVKKIDEGWDLVSGWKKKRYDPFVKRFSSKFFNFTTRIFSGIKIHDFNCGLKAYRKSAAQSILVYGELHRYMPVLAHWNGFSVTEIEVKHHPRMYGKTKFGISRFFKGFVDLMTVVFLTRYIKRPMHLFGLLGGLTVLAGFAVNGYLTWEWTQGQPLSNRPMLFLGMLLIIVGVQFFSTGLLGELMVHNFQNDAEYKIKEQQN